MRFARPSPASAMGTQTLIAAAGFEERCLAHLKHCVAEGVRYERIILVDYIPKEVNNRYDEAMALANQVAPAVETVQFDRFYPHDTLDLHWEGIGECTLDISGMSRFLVMVLAVRSLRNKTLRGLVYTQPHTYHPTEQQYREKVTNASEVQGLIFLTTGLFGVTTVPDLTTSTMQGEPEILVASPSFEPLFMRALLNEFSPADLVLLEMVPSVPDRMWRREAVRELNAFAFEIAGTNVVEVPVDSINAVFDAICKLYRKYKYSRRMVVTPPVSKLGAVGMALAIVYGEVECEVVYPTPLGFSDPYSEGIGERLEFVLCS